MSSMARETRLNLIFLGILLAVMLPGAIILFRKKLDPTVRPMYLPDPVPHAVGYMVPGETPPGMSRVVPPHTAAWVAELVKAHAPQAKAVDGQRPLMSENAAFQVLALDWRADRLTAVVLLWRDVAGASWSVQAGQRFVPGAVQAAKEVAVPNIVWQELGEYGVLRPPKTMSLQAIVFDCKVAPISRLLLNMDKGEEPLDSVPLFTNPASTTEYQSIP